MNCDVSFVGSNCSVGIEVTGRDFLGGGLGGRRGKISGWKSCKLQMWLSSCWGNAGDKRGIEACQRSTGSENGSEIRFISSLQQWDTEVDSEMSLWC